MSRETGGTVVSTAFEEMLRVVARRAIRGISGIFMRRRHRMATIPRWIMPR